MPNVTIRNLPVEVHQVLTARAQRAGQSLQQYLVETLTGLTEQLTMSEWLESVEEMHRDWEPRPPLSADEVVEAIALGRKGSGDALERR